MPALVREGASSSIGAQKPLDGRASPSTFAQTKLALTKSWLTVAQSPAADGLRFLKKLGPDG